MRNSLFSTFVAAAVFALAGCAADANEPTTENTDSTQGANVMDDRAHNVLTGNYDTQGVGGRSGVTVAADEQIRMYDFDAVPRIGQRSQYDQNLVELNNASVIPHSAQMQGTEIRRSAGTNATVNP